LKQTDILIISKFSTLISKIMLPTNSLFYIQTKETKMIL